MTSRRSTYIAQHVAGGREGIQDSFSSERAWTLDPNDMMHVAAGYAMAMMVVLGMTYKRCFVFTDIAEKPCCIFPHTHNKNACTTRTVTHVYFEAALFHDKNQRAQRVQCLNSALPQNLLILLRYNCVLRFPGGHALCGATLVEHPMKLACCLGQDVEYSGARVAIYPKRHLSFHL